MTTPAPSPVSPAGQATFPTVFDGIGALVVNCALDPDQLADRIPGLTWIAPKRGGTDVADDAETLHCVQRWRARGLAVGAWVYCAGAPPRDHGLAYGIGAQSWEPSFVIFDVEAEYKADEGGHYEWAQELVGLGTGPATLPTAVTSYGGYKTSIDFGAFARAGWPILAQVYDSYQPGDELTYRIDHGGVYPAAISPSASGVHALLRRLQLRPGEAVYRPESIDG